MTITFAVNSDNDLYIGADGNLVIVSGLTAVMQACEQAAKTLLGELVLATDQGVPYFQSVWSGVPNIQQFEVALRTAILNVPDVLSVVSLTVTQDMDKLQYIAVISTIYGTGEINV